MGIPNKRSRRIVVDEQNYRYIITGNDGYIDLILESDEVDGQRLTVSFNYNPDEVWGKQTAQITPSVVKQVINYGLKNEWTPTEKGKEIRVGYIDEKIKLK